ncbi:MAG: hypothetical protein AB1861_08400 [Cyanobacteriota bacterium]
MPPVYSTATVAATSSTDDLLLTKTRIIHSALVSISASSMATATEVGRNRRPVFDRAKSSATSHVRGLRKCYSRVVLAAESSAQCTMLSVIPAIAAPTGELFLNGSRLKEQRLPKGRSHTLSFSITGKRLDKLDIAFSLRSLSGQPLLSKTSRLGISIEEIVAHAGGSQTVTGYVLLLPRDTIFLESASELELNYTFSIGNGSTREHLLESDFLTFYLV